MLCCLSPSLPSSYNNTMGKMMKRDERREKMENETRTISFDPTWTRFSIGFLSSHLILVSVSWTTDEKRRRDHWTSNGEGCDGDVDHDDLQYIKEENREDQRERGAGGTYLCFLSSLLSNFPLWWWWWLLIFLFINCCCCFKWSQIGPERTECNRERGNPGRFSWCERIRGGRDWK